MFFLIKSMFEFSTTKFGYFHVEVKHLRLPFPNFDINMAMQTPFPTLYPSIRLTPLLLWGWLGRCDGLVACKCSVTPPWRLMDALSIFPATFDSTIPCTVVWRTEVHPSVESISSPWFR